ncbi:MAG: helix-turn-helix domain-containing protein [Rubrivivax sp.]
MRVIQEHVTHPDAAFRFLSLELPTFGGPRHRHDEVELTWVVRGRGVRVVGDSTEPFEDDDLVLLGPQVPHLWAGQAPAGEPPFRARVLQFPLALLASPLWPELRPARPLMERARRGLRVTGQAHAPVAVALQAMEAADPLQRLSLFVLVVRALTLHARSLRPLSAAVVRGHSADGGSGQARIDRVIGWIHAHLSEPLRVEEAARVAHITPAAFSRFFRRETGKTWSTYLNDLRCSEAAVRLRQGSRPVATIAHECGYPTLSHFNRAFAARFHLTPSRYRRG